MRYKIPYAVDWCPKCYQADLSTDGHVVKCKCGAESNVESHGKETRKFARRVRHERVRLTGASSGAAGD